MALGLIKNYQLRVSMTLWINGLHEKTDVKKSLSDILIHEAKKPLTKINLSSDGPLFDTIHPQILKTIINYNETDESGAEQNIISGWFIYPFKNTEEALQSGFTHQVIKGTPAAIFDLINGGNQIEIIDFDKFGSALFSKSSLEIKRNSDIYSKMLPMWTNYALSPELWGPQGKWTRFHERLETILKKHGLLKSKSMPGYYELNPEAQKLESFNITGDKIREGYNITLSWTFSLTELKKLENVISQEF